MLAPDPAGTWSRVADGFRARADAAAPEAWDAASPCEGWTARAVVGHLTAWVPAFLEAGAGLHLDPGPDPAADPAGAWRHLDDAIRELLASPDIAQRRFEHPQAGSHALSDAVLAFVAGDVLVHTWDLARATGQDETLDPELVRVQLLGMEPIAPALAASGHYAAVVEVAPDADEQTRLLALTGRRA